MQNIERDDLFRLQFLQSARLSPDGKQVSYAVSRVEGDRECVAIWLLSLETGTRRQLTAGTTRDSNPEWSPDGGQIAYISTRAGAPQIYLISPNGGEARALTSMPYGVYGGPTWSPDGKQIAFTAAPPGQPRDPNKPYRVTRILYRFDGMGNVEDVLQDIYVVSANGGEPRQLTAGDYMKVLPVWSPDGRKILFGAWLFREGCVWMPQLQVVTLDGQVVEPMGDQWMGYSAAWLPDSERIAVVGAPEPLSLGPKHLWIVPSGGGEPVCRTAGLKVGAGGGLSNDMPLTARNPSLQIARDGRTAYAQVQDGGTLQLYRIALDGPEDWSPVVTGERACLLQGMDDAHLLFAAGTLNNPMDLYIASLDGSNERRLTSLNSDLMDQRRLPTTEHLLFPSTDGTQVEGWIMLPPGGQPPYPTLLAMHGGPQGAYGHAFTFDFQMLAGAGYAVLFINCRGSTGYGAEFSDVIAEWGNQDYKDLMAGVDYAIARGLADPARLGCFGLSYGGYMSCWIVGQTDRFKAAVPENPVTNLISKLASDIAPSHERRQMGGLPHEVPEVYRRCSPITYAHRCKTPTLLIVGELDHRCPPEQAEQFYAVLKANGCVAEMLRLPNSPHSGSAIGPLVIRKAQNEALLDWMNHYVMGMEVQK